MGLRLSTRVCPVHLVDELVLVTGPILNLLRFLGGREQVSMVFVPWELMLFLFIYCFIILLFIYLFIYLFMYVCIYLFIYLFIIYLFIYLFIYYR